MLCREHTSKTIRYGTRSQGISHFYSHKSTIVDNDFDNKDEPDLSLISRVR